MIDISLLQQNMQVNCDWLGSAVAELGLNHANTS